MFTSPYKIAQESLIYMQQMFVNVVKENLKQPVAIVLNITNNNKSLTTIPIGSRTKRSEMVSPYQVKLRVKI